MSNLSGHEIPSHSELSYNGNNRTLTINYDHSLGHFENTETLECVLSQYADFTEKVVFRINFPEPQTSLRYNIPTFGVSYTTNYGPINQSENLQRIADLVRVLKENFRRLSTVEIVFRLTDYDFDQLSCAAPFFDLPRRCPWNFKYSCGRCEYGRYITVSPGEILYSQLKSLNDSGSYY